MPKIVDHDARRLEILAAAREVFGEEGLTGTNLSQVARRAGMSKSALYHYFDTREALLDALMSSLLDREVAFCDAVLGGEGSVGDRLQVCLGGVMGLVDEWTEVGPLMLAFLQTDAGRDAVGSTLERVRTAIAAVLAEGQATGTIRAGDPEQMADVVVATLDGLLIVELVRPGTAQDPAFRATLASMLQAAVTP